MPQAEVEFCLDMFPVRIQMQPALRFYLRVKKNYSCRPASQSHSQHAAWNGYFTRQEIYGDQQQRRGEKKGISIIDLSTNQELYFIPQDPLFIGVKFSKDGSKLYASGGGANKVYVYAVNMVDRYFSLQKKSIDVPGFPGGMAMSPDGNDLFVADNLGNTVTDINTVTDTAAASLPTGNSPYTCEVSPDGKQVFVSNWADRSVSIYNRVTPNTITNSPAATQTGPIAPAATVPVGEHPTAIAISQDGGTVYITNGNTDNVSVLKKGADAAWVEDTRIDVDPEFKTRFPTQKKSLQRRPERTFFNS